MAGLDVFARPVSHWLMNGVKLLPVLRPASDPLVSFGAKIFALRDLTMFPSEGLSDMIFLPPTRLRVTISRPSAACHRARMYDTGLPIERYPLVPYSSFVSYALGLLLGPATW